MDKPPKAPLMDGSVIPFEWYDEACLQALAKMNGETVTFGAGKTIEPEIAASAKVSKGSLPSAEVVALVSSTMSASPLEASDSDSEPSSDAPEAANLKSSALPPKVPSQDPEASGLKMSSLPLEVRGLEESRGLIVVTFPRKSRCLMKEPMLAYLMQLEKMAKMRLSGNDISTQQDPDCMR
ncbi:OLC1v1018609C1 [Oldenlandia corymbosa var. corymbosa]|uniref:OLC1v1018609C1 n=1 Tax=Oldenlandia corymbosa var. corymbosa TaxID=529605 RepID=A0AAV1EC23_OLDCO|nr:OLC1v1018609C1 [Oldenlandia corymbosa var. corymbosa]